jgi:hypothetical protein
MKIFYICVLALGHIGASTSNRDWTGNRTQTWSSKWEYCPDFTHRTSGLEITVHHCLSSPSFKGFNKPRLMYQQTLSLIYIYVLLYSTHKWEDNFVLPRRAYFLFVFITAYNFICCIRTWILSSNTAALSWRRLSAPVTRRAVLARV